MAVDTFYRLIAYLTPPASQETEFADKLIVL